MGGWLAARVRGNRGARGGGSREDGDDRGAVAHYAHHVGQIVFLAKHLAEPSGGR